MKVTQCIAIFLNCNFNGNHAEFGGSICGDLSSNITISNCTFCNNTAEKYGGAIFAGSTTAWQDNNAIISKHGKLLVFSSSFSFNEAYKQYGGGIAIFCINMSIYESNSVSNIAESSGGALFSNMSSMANISKTVFSGNNASSDCGGAVQMLKSTLAISNSNFSHNSIAKGHGGALCIQEGRNDINDCYFSFNEAETFGGAIYIRNSQQSHLVKCYFDTNIVLAETGGGRTMRIYREANLVIANSSFSDHGSLSYRDGDKALYNRTSFCQKSNAGYRISGVGLLMTSSTVVFNSTKFTGSCESIYAYKCNINFTGNISFIGIDNRQPKAPSALYIIQSIVSFDGNCTFMYNAAVSGGAIHAAESRIDVNGELVVANNTALENGGGIYLYRSDFNCRISSTIKMVSNYAHRGGGLHAISATIKVTYIRDNYPDRASLYFITNNSTDGGGVYLEANAKLLVLKEGTTRNNLTQTRSIFFRDNTAK